MPLSSYKNKELECFSIVEKIIVYYVNNWSLNTTKKFWEKRSNSSNETKKLKQTLLKE